MKKTLAPCCANKTSPLRVLKPLPQKEISNLGGTPLPVIVELNNTMEFHFMRDKATSKTSLKNSTLIASVNTSISGIKELCLKAGVPRHLCKVRAIMQTKVQETGNDAGILEISNSSNQNQMMKLMKTSNGTQQHNATRLDVSETSNLLSDKGVVVFAFFLHLN